MEWCAYMAHLAEKRLAKTEARETLRMARAIRVAVWGDKGAVDGFEGLLMKNAGLAPVEPPKAKRKKALAGLAAAVAARGGKVSNG